MSTVAASNWPIFKSQLVMSWPIAGRTMAFRFDRPEGWSFSPGQFIDITLLNPRETDAEGNVRGFSLASAPDEETLLIATRLRDSAFKRVLAASPAGTEVKIEGPFGNFRLHHDSRRPAVMLAGGIGITPFRSILLDATGRKLNHRIMLFHFNRRPEDAPFFEEFQHLASRNPNFHLIAVMTQPERSSRNWKGETGHFNQAMLERYAKDLNDPVYYIAGPTQMVKGIRTVLNAAGVNDDNIRIEEFTGY